MFTKPAERLQEHTLSMPLKVFSPSVMVTASGCGMAEAPRARRILANTAPFMVERRRIAFEFGT